MAEETENKPVPKESKKKKKESKEKKRGVVYLSCIPRCMNLKRLRQEMENNAEVGNIYLEPDDKPSHNPHQRVYKEGWVEFRDKADAKQVAAMLNNNQVGGRRKNPWRDEIWNIKYLPKFQWAHLNARLAYERGVSKQRLRADISQIKREATLHKKNHLQNKIKKKQKKDGVEEEGEEKTFKIPQRKTETEVLNRKRKMEEEGGGDEDDEVGGSERKKKAKRVRVKKSMHRPDADHPIGALSLGANPQLLQKLFGGKS
ncbi:hypothetical protein ACOMHN_000517 [Nucella lapillus]